MATDRVSLLPLGAIIQSFNVDGLNIVQGFPTQALYTQYNSPFFGETIGRVANRISGAKINSLNGKSYELAANNGPNNLHGGVKGWGKLVWDGPETAEEIKVDGLELTDAKTLKFTLTSRDGDEGFPGTVEASVVYTSGSSKGDNGEDVNTLIFDYEVKLVGDAEETAVNLTNHSYFNLSGKPTIEGTEATIITNTYLPVDDGGIPNTTTPAPFSKFSADTPFTLGKEEPDIDDCFIVDTDAGSVPLDTRSRPLQRLVHARHPDTKINLEVWSSEPAFQFYTGKYIDVPEVEGAPARGARSAFCVEPSRYVNAVNVDEWKGQVLLKKGDTYGARILYKGWKA